MERYYERRDIRKGRERVCKRSGCDTKLSRYNEEPYCSVHVNRRGDNKDLLQSLGIL